MRKKLAAVLAVLTLVAAMSIVPGQSALAQGPPAKGKVCLDLLRGGRPSAENIAQFIACVLGTGGDPEIK